MELAPDFFTYFEVLAPLLDEDERLFCISSWNDHGQVTLMYGQLQGALHTPALEPQEDPPCVHSALLGNSCKAASGHSCMWSPTVQVLPEETCAGA